MAFSWILVPKSVPKRLRRKDVPESFFEGVFEGFFDDLPRFPVELPFCRHSWHLGFYRVEHVLGILVDDAFDESFS